MEGVASNRYKNLAYIAKEILIRYQGETDLRNYAGFPRAPMYADRVQAIFSEYEGAQRNDGIPDKNAGLLRTPTGHRNRESRRAHGNPGKNGNQNLDNFGYGGNFADAENTQHHQKKMERSIIQASSRDGRSRQQIKEYQDQH